MAMWQNTFIIDDRPEVWEERERALVWPFPDLGARRTRTDEDAHLVSGVVSPCCSTISDSLGSSTRVNV